AQTNLENGAPLALGEDQFSQTTFANKLFLRNLVQYLAEPEGIIASRTRTFQIRPLNKVKIVQQRTFWQGFNVLLPVIVLLSLGGIVWWIRKNKYSRKLN